MSQQKAKSSDVFLDSWATFNLEPTAIEYKLNIPTKSIAELDKNKFAHYRGLAVLASLVRCGDNPAVMLSGGIDSQAMAYSFAELGVPFTPVILDYDGKNDFDVSVAVDYSEKVLNITPVIIKLNLIRFFMRECVQFGRTFGIRSPQFASHAKACTILKEAGYTGAIFGGNAMARLPNSWIISATAAQMLDLADFSAQYGWPIISSFLSFRYENCIALSVLSDPVFTAQDVDDRYKDKISAYGRYGIPVIPQQQKYTGFEQIKIEIDAGSTGPGAFERMFRAPLYANCPNKDPITIMTPHQLGAMKIQSVKLRL